MIDKWLTKGATFVSILHCFLVADAGEAEALDDDANAFMVEISHYNCLTILVLSFQLFVSYLSLPLKP